MVRGGEKPTVSILGVNVSVAPFESTAVTLVEMARTPSNNGSRYACATSVHGLIEADRDPEFRRILNKAAFVVPDGMPLVWFGRLRRHREMERVYGPSLMKRVCALSAEHGLRHFFYGGAPGVADDLARRMAGEFPGLQVAGTYCPPFRTLRDDELDQIANVINDAGAQIVWVGLSTPKQERWISAVRDKLESKVLVSVGAAFDFHTGRVRQAPNWMQASGLEWIFRLSREPRRMWRRYAYNNPRFVYLATLQLAGLKDFSDHDDPVSDRDDEMTSKWN